uniref:Peroxidase n=1 Tax=Colletotrichum fructicola (strain Nara gc5) TaxID=1213859 RepID=L2G2T3_COLFN
MAASTRQFARAAMRTTARNTFAVAPRQAFRQQGRRFYSSEPASKSGSSTWIWLTGAAVVGAGGYFYTREGGVSAGSTPKIVNPTKADYEKVYKAIADRLEENDDGTFDKETGTGGSNGATMRFAPESDHGANAGLKAARDFLEPVKKQFPWISYSDLWILGGVCAIQEMQGPVIPYRPGRKDGEAAACTPDGRLPDASKREKHLRDIFYRMGFNDQEIVALAGAHALGRCHTDRSGFDGPWTFSPTVLTNDYYKLLLNEKWQWKKWDGPAQYEDKGTKTLMMLPADYALIQDKTFKKYVEQYAKDNDSFFKDFSNVIVKLFELGVPFAQGEDQRWTFKPTWAE